MTSVIKRNNTVQTYDDSKLESFILSLCNIEPQLNHVDVKKIIPLQGLPSKSPSTQEIASLVSETAAAYTVSHVDYGRLAGRCVVSNLLKTCAPTFSEATSRLSILDAAYKKFVLRHKDVLDGWIVRDRNFHHDVFSIETLKRSYLLRDEKRQIVETPQQLWMRVAVAIHQPDMESIKETYELLSQGFYTQATPTLFNSGIRDGQLASCFLLDCQDSIEGIYSALKSCALISKQAGGIGLNINRIRGCGARIKGTGGVSSGIVPMLKVFESTALYVDQGGGKRKGSIACFLTPSHPDIMDFLQLRQPDGVESRRCRSLFTGLMIPDIFMERVKKNEMWSLFQPTDVPELEDTYGERYEKVYKDAEKAGLACGTYEAREIWATMIRSIIESGGPYCLFRDTINKHNNQVGLVRQSNLCVEIMETTDYKTETAVCTLASVCLPKMIEKDEQGELFFSFEKLRSVVAVVVRNLNKTIGRSTYPVHSAKYSHFKRRPIAVGVQGLSDTFQRLSLVFGTPECLDLDARIFETIYLQACTTSHEIAKELGPYSTFNDSPMARGKFQFDLYDTKINLYYKDEWDRLRKNIVENGGVRNSLLVALMPTASSAQIMQNSESFAVRSSNAYVRRTLSGEFICVNHVLQESREWTQTMAEELLQNRGSVQNMSGISDHDKQVFRTIYECSMRDHITHCAVRQPFVDQSQSMSLWFSKPTVNKLSSALFFAHSQKLKTGMYYCRREVTGKTMGTLEKKTKEKTEMKCDGDVCEMCSA